MILIATAVPFALVLLTAVAAALLLRRIVPVNEVHVVQYASKTVSYGKDLAAGNSYYQWPAWMPWIGTSCKILPVSVFDLDLPDYEAYDQGRLALLVHVKAFFRITDSNTAAQRISDFQELNDQLEAVVQGSLRSVLASTDIMEIMHKRSEIEDKMTKEVGDQLHSWGVENVKSIELMDIRDAAGSDVIHTIMTKRKSEIEMESRVEIAKNGKLAMQAEIEAKREVELHNQQAHQEVGLRTIEAQNKVELAAQTAAQTVKETEKLTQEKVMAVQRVLETRKAEIEREAALVRAEQAKKTAVLAAEGQLEATRLQAEGTTLAGVARAAAEKAFLLAPVEAQVTLAKEIGQNANYQSYLVTLEKVKATAQIGTAQAAALNKADIKVIVNAGAPAEGVTKVMDLFSSKGGTELGAMFEALKNTPTGKDVIERFLKKEDGAKTPTAAGKTEKA